MKMSSLFSISEFSEAHGLMEPEHLDPTVTRALAIGVSDLWRPRLHCRLQAHIKMARQHDATLCR